MNFEISTFIFVGTVLLFFYLSAPRFKAAVLSVASLIFCFHLDPYAVIVLLCVSFLSFLTGIVLYRIENEDYLKKKSMLWTYIILASGCMIGWKYLYSPAESSLIKLAMPVGLSFYTIQSISYVCDVYNNRIVPEKDAVKYLLYMSWFPKLTSGPIERGGDLIPQFDGFEEVRLFDGRRITRALSYILWGFFLKLMIADRAAIVVDAVFDRSDEFGALMLALGSLLYTIQIYCDFAGYTDIAIGVSCLFGIELSQNFKTPYFSENITEFWRAWHITLSSFLRDYIYIPLGGNRKGLFRKSINLMIVFLVCGIWHGRGLSFVVWGLLHGIYSVAADLMKRIRFDLLIRGAVGTIFTFCCVSFAWIFFRAETLMSAFRYIRGFFSNGVVTGSLVNELTNAEFTVFELAILGAAILLVFFCDLIAKRGNTVMPEVMLGMGEIQRDCLFLILTVLTLIFGIYGNLEVKNFIYMNF